MSRINNPSLNFRADADPRGGELTGNVIVSTPTGGATISLSAAKDGMADLEDVIAEIEGPPSTSVDEPEMEVEDPEEEPEEEAPDPPKKPSSKKK